MPLASTLEFVGSDVFTAVVMKSIIFWNMSLATCMLAEPIFLP
jgi:hypothetical protein